MAIHSLLVSNAMDIHTPPEEVTFVFNKRLVPQLRCFYPLPQQVEYGSDYHLLRLKLYAAHRAVTNVSNQQELEYMRSSDWIYPADAAESLLRVESLQDCDWPLPSRATPRSLADAPTKLRLNKGKGRATADDRQRWQRMQLNLSERLERASAPAVSVLTVGTCGGTPPSINRLFNGLIANRSPGLTDHSGWCAAWQSQDSFDQDMIIFQQELDRDEDMTEEKSLTCHEVLSIHSDTDSEDEGLGPQTVEDARQEEENDLWRDLDEFQLRQRLQEAKALKYKQQRLLYALHEAIDNMKAHTLKMTSHKLWTHEGACEREDRLQAMLNELPTRKRQYQEACGTVDNLEFVLVCEQKRLKACADVEYELP